MNAGLKGSAVVLLSGGMDSAVALAVAREAGFLCHCLSVEYGQRHCVEVEAARRVAGALGVPAGRHRVVRVDLRAIGGSALTGDAAVPKGRAGDEIGAGAPVTYVPARNMLLLSLAVGMAETIDGGDGPLCVVIGANAVDFSGYPDCRESFLRAFEKAAEEGTKAGSEGRGVRVWAPLVRMTKAAIVREGLRLGVDFALTHSCYDPVVERGEAFACGSCDACALRRKGFEEAGVADPTRYATVKAGVR